MKFKYSDGEKTVQKNAGVEHFANRLINMVKDHTVESGQNFINYQSLFFISSVDSDNNLWTSIIVGKKSGFIKFISDDNIEIHLSDIFFNKQDILYDNIKQKTQVGLLFIEFGYRRRFRINGNAKITADKIIIEIVQSFPNCPKYIQARKFQIAPEIVNNINLEEKSLGEINNIIKKADTFFMGTRGKDGGLDCSHRGGNPGFLEILNENVIKIPDYSGNNMFLSLGNIIENPNTGLLFVDFQNGSTLQLSGKAKVALNESDIRNGVERFWYFEIEKNIFTENAVPLKWSEPLYSPLNPEISH